MPRITAPTLAQHRSRQLHALLEAAREIVREAGPQALTLAALARRVGLSRPSLYEYFPSRDDLVVALLAEDVPAWADRLRAALAAHGTLEEQVAAFVRAELELMREQAMAVALIEHALTPRERVRREHARLLRPLVDALAAAGVPEPELRAELVEGVVTAAGHRLYAGADPETVIAAAVAQAVHGIGGWARG